MPQTAKYNAVPGCPRVTVLSINRDTGTALVESDEAEPGHERLTVPLAELSSFEGEGEGPEGPTQQRERLAQLALLIGEDSSAGQTALSEYDELRADLNEGDADAMDRLSERLVEGIGSFEGFVAFVRAEVGNSGRAI